MINFLNDIANFLPHINLDTDENYITFNIGISSNDENQFMIEHYYGRSGFFLELPDIEDFTDEIYSYLLKNSKDISSRVRITKDDNVYLENPIDNVLLLNKKGIYNQIYFIICNSIIYDLQELTSCLENSLFLLKREYYNEN